MKREISLDTYMLAQTIILTVSGMGTRGAKTCVDSVLENNNVTVREPDAPVVRPMSESAFYRICEDRHEVGDGIEGIMEALKERGLIV